MRDLHSFIFCETPDHVSFARQNRSQSTIIALTPESAWFCQKADLAYSRLDDFYSYEGVNEIADRTIKREYAWTAWLDKKLEDMFPEFATIGFKPARAQLYFLKRSIDSYIRPAYILLEFIANSKAQHITVFERPPEHWIDFNISPPYRYFFAWIAKELAGNKIVVEVLPNQSDSYNVIDFNRGSYIHRVLNAPLTHIMNRVRKELSAGIHNFRFRNKRILLNGSGFETEHVVPLLRKKGIAVLDSSGNSKWLMTHSGEGQKIKEKLESAWSLFSNSSEFWQIVDFVSPALRSLTKTFFENWFIKEIPLAWVKFLGARNYLTMKNIKAVIGSDSHTATMLAIYMAAESLDIPRILSVHRPPAGANYLPVQDALGPVQCDAYLVNGEGDIEFFKNLAINLGTFSRGDIIAVGSSYLEAIKMPIRKKSLRDSPKVLKKQVLYVSSQYMGNQRYFNEGEISDLVYFELQQRILKCCAEFPDVDLLYKPFPFDYAKIPIQEFIDNQAPNCKIIDGKLSELMMSVDAIVIDFISTAVAEAVMTDKPLVVYAGKEWSRIFSQAKNALEKRALVSETPEDFEKSVRKLLSSRLDPIENPDIEFRHLYCTHYYYGHAAERAAEYIYKIVAN